MLCWSHTAFVVRPPAASRKIPTTCSSLYRLLFMFCPFLEDQNYTFNPSHFPGSGHRPSSSSIGKLRTPEKPLQFQSPNQTNQHAHEKTQTHPHPTRIPKPL